MSSVFCEPAMTVPHIVSDTIWDAEMSDAVTTIETAVPFFRFKLDKYKLKGYDVLILTNVHLLLNKYKVYVGNADSTAKLAVYLNSD